MGTAHLSPGCSTVYWGKNEVLSSWRLGTWAPWISVMFKLEQSIERWAPELQLPHFPFFSWWKLEELKIEGIECHWMSLTSLYWLWSMHLFWPGLTPSWWPFLQEPEENGTCCPGSLEIKRGCTFPENRRPKLCFTVVQLYSNHLWQFTSIYKMHRPNINITSSPYVIFYWQLGTGLPLCGNPSTWPAGMVEVRNLWGPHSGNPEKKHQLDNTKTTLRQQ